MATFYAVRYLRDYYSSDHYDHCKPYKGMESDYPITLAGKYFKNGSSFKHAGGVSFDCASIFSKKQVKKITKDWSIYPDDLFEIIPLEISEPE
jgi:hypothetical protein